MPEDAITEVADLRFWEKLINENGGIFSINRVNNRWGVMVSTKQKAFVRDGYDLTLLLLEVRNLMKQEGLP